MPRFLLRTTWVKFSRTLEDAEAFHDLVSGIRGIPPGPGQGKGIFEGECPYRGLEPFRLEHARFFFGREAQIDWLLENRLAPLARSGPARRFLAILGPSGSGKSSLALAGLVPALRASKVEGSATWPIAILRPGYDPFESLTFELSKLKDLADSGPALLARTCEYLRVRDFADDPRGAPHLRPVRPRRRARRPAASRPGGPVRGALHPLSRGARADPPCLHRHPAARRDCRGRPGPRAADHAG